ncbi:hypothetical protein NE237_016335 [Protea cynaroides]|uniref:Uncharacterized protein n=1 Tax=Protea cynaroides TaxID=273540 RepID=A0A9Q0GKU5_9MAGN|nr:hypothetical protein NE237_016335 [Protea cynaroides]
MDDGGANFPNQLPGLENETIIDPNHSAGGFQNHSAGGSPNLGKDEFPPLHSSAEPKLNLKINPETSKWRNPLNQHVEFLAIKRRLVKSQQATYVNENREKATDGISPSVLGKAIVNEDDSQLKGSVAGFHEGPESQSRLEEVWTSIRVKKKRSDGSLGGLNPTQLPTHLPPPLRQNLTLGQVSTLACPEAAFCVPNRFGCLNSDDDQTALPGPSDPPASPAIVQPTPGPSDPLPDPTEPLPSPGLNSPSCSAGHTLYPPRRPFPHKPHGSLRQPYPSCMVAIKTPSGSTRTQPGALQSPLCPIAPLPPS